MDEEKKEDSSSVSTPDSSSTYQYQHEAYSTFQKKVLVLAHSLGDFEDVSLERIRGGDYNRVVIAHLIRDAEAETVKGIFRIPRFTDISLENEEDGDVQTEKKVQDQVAVLQFLALRDISVPAPLAFDASAANLIGRPYELQEYSTGTCLKDIYPTMSLQEKLDIADGLVEYLLSAERIKFPDFGHLRAARDSNAPVKWSSFSGSAQLELDVEIVGLGEDEEAPPQDSELLQDFLSRRLKWQCQEQSLVEEYPKLCAILEEMEELGLFSMQKEIYGSTTWSILYHWDLQPRNILVKPKTSLAKENSSSTTIDEPPRWEIDKIIDWDEAQVLPAVLTRQPPIWLWDYRFLNHSDNPSVPSVYDGDEDILPPSRYDSSSGRLSSADQEIRQHFEDLFVQKLGEIYLGYGREVYLEEAYGKGRWIRRLTRWALDGIHGDQDLKKFEHFEKEWALALPEYRIQVAMAALSDAGI